MYREVARLLGYWQRTELPHCAVARIRQAWPERLDEGGASTVHPFLIYVGDQSLFDLWAVQIDGTAGA